MSSPKIEYDLLIVTDATASMTSYLKSLLGSLQTIIRISNLTDCFSKIGVLAYRDYDCWGGSLTEWSGWHSRGGTDPKDISQQQLLDYVTRLTTHGGYSWPEATKSGLAHAYRVMREGVKTIVLLYADAPPHAKILSENAWKVEQEELKKDFAYDGHGGLFADWVSAANTLGQGAKQAQVFSIIELSSSSACFPDETAALYTFLSTRTGGVCLGFEWRPTAEGISKLTVGLLLAWMGAEKQGAQLDTAVIAKHIHFADTEGFEEVVNETDENAAKFLPVSRKWNPKEAMKNNTKKTGVSLASMSKTIPTREEPVIDFAKRYAADPGYQKLVVQQLGELIAHDVAGIALNPVFGSLWRTVCNDRSNEARDHLITSFGLHVDRIVNPDQKARMKQWLDESYDRLGEIVEIIKSVPEDERYPCVFLDPTLRFSTQNVDGEEDSLTFTRDELLEIGRSCDYRILRRLGTVLTRLTYVASKDEVPAHIKKLSEKDLPRLPMALVKPEYHRKFWKILLHTVLPGTMLAARPAALLAALSIRMGLKPLREAAYAELTAASNGWNTLDIPETWNTNCLNLLLEAYNKRRNSAWKFELEDTVVLKEEDRKLFQALVDYKLLEMNLGTSLTAQVGFTPEKTKLPLGPGAFCKQCRFPRSATIMGSGGICGVCLYDYSTPEIRMEAVTAHVSKSDNSSTKISWVECSMTDCRAQYVVYSPEKLRVRPKCYFCRMQGIVPSDDPDYKRLTTAPCVPCNTCVNRVIWPEEYRPVGFDESAYQCPACKAGEKTIADEEVTVRTLAEENGNDWLIRNEDNTVPDTMLFAGQSVFRIVSSVPREDFASKVSILPQTDSLPQLSLRGKKIHNVEDVLASIRKWVDSRRVQAGTCSLCFSNHKKTNLRPACGRRGCKELVCDDCMTSWYGINQKGKIINVAALSCPFCRRQPTTKVILPEGLRTLGGLRDAVDEAGSWIYGWCTGCGFAKRHLERVCAAGAPADVENWTCEDCDLARQESQAKKAGKDFFIVIKDCPGCGVSTEKSAGCDHMECGNCGVHWCFNCGKKVAANKIYEHMTEAHGGWFAGRDYEAAYDSEEEEAYENWT
ncbi:E3 ubiquitin-protein ligase itt1 [Podospora australis]|uniref:E3 ubiquitin-protein ligase itt1 n=1 Tax=Podospora australis TaxID=1536484 RepID=A0AAN6WPQ7_9PEZI|nr:E3 ubiquitin-protein ligase itt1 [Podospora australis]